LGIRIDPKKPVNTGDGPTIEHCKAVHTGSIPVVAFHDFQGKQGS
jgi:hypothetical protein